MLWWNEQPVAFIISRRAVIMTAFGIMSGTIPGRRKPGWRKHGVMDGVIYQHGSIVLIYPLTNTRPILMHPRHQFLTIGYMRRHMHCGLFYAVFGGKPVIDFFQLIPPLIMSVPLMGCWRNIVAIRWYNHWHRYHLRLCRWCMIYHAAPVGLIIPGAI